MIERHVLAKRGQQVCKPEAIQLLGVNLMASIGMRVCHGVLVDGVRVAVCMIYYSPCVLLPGELRRRVEHGA